MAPSDSHDSAFLQFNISTWFDGQLNSDPSVLAKFVSSFYSKLYAVKDPNENAQQFLDDMNSHSINPSEREICDSCHF